MFRPCVSILMALCALFALSSCQQPQKPKFLRLENVSIASLGSESLRLKGEAVLNNPNAFSVHVTGLEAEVFIDGQAAGVVQEDQDVEVPASSDFTVPLLAELKYETLGNQDMISALLGVLTSQKLPLTIKGDIVIRAVAADFRIPFEYEQEVPVKF